MPYVTRLIAIFSLAAGVAAAQPPLGPPPGGPLDIERLAILLDLDAYQKGEVERVLTQQRDERMKARAELNDSSAEPPSREDMQARREQSREQVFNELKNVLTEQQMTKLKLLMEPPRGGGGRGPGGPGAF